MKNKKIFIVIAIVLVAVSGVIFYFVWKSGQSPIDVSDTPVNSLQAPAALQEQVFVDIDNYKFAPSSVTIKRGGAVVWTNLDSSGHDIVSDSGYPGFRSPIFISGGRYSFTFDEVGSYAYHCGVHPSMKGTVVVVE